MSFLNKKIIIPLVLGVFIVSILICYFLKGSLPGIRASMQPTITFTPQTLPLNEAEVLNTNRGFYKWKGGEVVPMGDGVTNSNTSYDVYDRYTWNKVEPTAGTWDFTAMKAAAAEARSKGGKYSFGIYTTCSSWCDKIGVPSDIAANTALYGGTKDASGVYIPDWNNPNFLNRMEQMLIRIGQEMNNDKDFGDSVGNIEIRIYGNWGEWHMYGLTGSTTITEANQKRIVDAHVKAFPGKQLIMMANGSYAFAYALDLNTTTTPAVSKPIGWRNDCLGLNQNTINSKNYLVEHFRNMAKESIPAAPTSTSPDYVYENYWKAVAWSKAKDRWQTAPAIAEFCPVAPDKKLEANLLGTPYPTEMQYSEVQTAIQQAKDFHISLIGNGNVASNFWYSTSKLIGGTNLEKWNAFPQTEKDKLFILGKTVGFRYELKSVNLPAQLVNGDAFSITSSWLNSGVAPTYENWDTTFELRDPNSGITVWKSNLSQMKFKGLLPSTTPTQITDPQVLSTLTPGLYEVFVKIVDSEKKADGSSISKPLALAIAGKQSDGSYKLGTIEVVNPVAPTVTPTVVPTVAFVEPTATNTVVPSQTVSVTPVPLNTVVPTSQPLPSSTPMSVQKVVSFSLINADTDTVIPKYEALYNGQRISLGKLPTKNLNIRVNTEPTTVGSVVFKVNGAVTSSENTAPYSAYGNTGTNYNVHTFATGTYTLLAIPYAGSDLTGQTGQSLQMNVTFAK
jgi:hypothetical protein